MVSISREGTITQYIDSLFRSKRVHPMKTQHIATLILGMLILAGFPACRESSEGVKTAPLDDSTQESNLRTTEAAKTEVAKPEAAKPEVVKTRDIHPALGFSFKAPANWKGKFAKAVASQDFSDFTSESPNHKTTSDMYAFLEGGAELLVRAEKTDKVTVDDFFSSNPLAPKIATNKTDTIVAGQKALQFDYSYEGHVATMTYFLHNGLAYTVKLRYVDKAGKNAFWADYLTVLTSFQLPKP